MEGVPEIEKRQGLSVEEQANSKESPTNLLVERMHAPAIRAQIFDLVEEIEKYKAENWQNFFYDAPYVPKTREQIEREFDEHLAMVENNTPISFDVGMHDVREREEKPPGREHSHEYTRHELITPNWINPGTGRKDNPTQISIIEAHEKGHVLRNYGYQFLDARFAAAFDPSAFIFTQEDLDKRLKYEVRDPHEVYIVPTLQKAREIVAEYLFTADEISERMSQLKNYFGFAGDETFTKEHLAYARDHYVQDTGLDNNMTYFFQAITPEKEDAFIDLINSTGI